MARYSEDQFNNWRRPPSNSEEQRLETTEQRIREAIQKSEELKEYAAAIFTDALMGVNFLGLLRVM